VEARFSAPDQTGPGAHPAFYTMGTGSYPRVRRTWIGLNHPPLSSVEVKEEKNYTSAPPLGLRGLFLGELYLYLYQFLFYVCHVSNFKCDYHSLRILTFSNLIVVKGITAKP